MSSTEIRYAQVDVFADRPFAGHQLVVCLDECPAELMAALSEQFNLVTAFPVLTGPHAYRIRIVEHGHELPFGGQPTLGTAWVLGPGRWTQHSPGATVTVEVSADGALMQMPDPVLTRLELGGRAGAALGLSGVGTVYRSVCGGNTHLLVPTEEDVEALQPDLDAVVALARDAGTNTVAPFRLVGGGLRQRVFAPSMGIAESPAVGTAAAPAALYAVRHWGLAPTTTVVQGAPDGRRSTLSVRAEAGAVRLGGPVRRFATGTFVL